jgi:hypothetical protein
VFPGTCEPPRRSILLAVALVALIACADPAPAAETFPGPPSIEELARQADVVVIGEVTAAAGEWDAARTNIVTRVRLERAEVLKGRPRSPITFTHLGGRVGDLESAVAGAARFTVGERALVFLAQEPDGGLRLAQLFHGKLRIERDPSTGREVAVRSAGARGADRVPLDQVRRDVRRTVGS